MISTVSIESEEVDHVVVHDGYFPAVSLQSFDLSEMVYINGTREQRIRVLRLWAEAEGVQTDGAS